MHRRLALVLAHIMSVAASENPVATAQVSNEIATTLLVGIRTSTN
jgi:hypothetical protein